MRPNARRPNRVRGRSLLAKPVWRVFVGTAISGVVVLVLASNWTVSGLGGWNSPGSGVAAGDAASEVQIFPSSFPIHHFIFVMMENHAYDNFFGDYCLVVGAYCDIPARGLDLATCLALDPNNTSKGCIRPFAISSPGPNDLGHGWRVSHSAYDNGAMDNFYVAEGNVTYPFSYYTGRSLPIYWTIAEQYALSDNFFSSALSYSLPNHWFALAGQSPYIATYHSFKGVTNIGPREVQYLDTANNTTTIQDTLNHSAVSWKYYYKTPAPTYDLAVNYRSVFNFFDPLTSRAETYTPYFLQHMQPYTNLSSDAKNGTLPNVSWVVPPYSETDHPPFSPSWGQGFVAQLLNDVESSPEWNSTAVYVAWDDYGGFYDSHPPPQIDQYGLSFRVPLLAVSPYTPQGYVSHDLQYFESYLRTIEWRFGLPNITARDGNAPLLTDFIDTHARPRPPLTLPSNVSNATYPIPYQPLPLPNPPTHVTLTAINATTARLTWGEGYGGAPVNRWLIHVGSYVLTEARTTHTALLSGFRAGSIVSVWVASEDGPNVSSPVYASTQLPVPHLVPPVLVVAARWHS